MKIIEELDDCLERDIKAYAFEQSISNTIMGKSEIEDWIGEYTPGRVFDILNKTWPGLLPGKPEAVDVRVQVPARPAQLCPGCGHRSAFYAVKNALTGTEITVADIGCHTLGFLPPYQVGEILMCMGASTGIGSGLSLFNDSRKVVAFLGDSTFFHAGLPGILNTLFNRHRVTLIVMENGTTAMTGHQDHPASGRNFNEPTEKIPIRRLLEGFGVEHIFEMDTYNQPELTKIVKKGLNVDGFSVVIAKHPCMLKFIREQQRKPGFTRGRVEIDQNQCDRLQVCMAQFGCPSFQLKPEGQIQVNPDLCIGDGSCIQTCPVEAIAPGKSG